MKLKTVATRPYVAALSEGDRSRLIQDRKQSLAPERRYYRYSYEN